jgi:glycosyltransferase involved in cell wall biosynthesis
VSVVVSARDEATSLDATLSSIDAPATDRSDDVVVGDGGGTDGTPAVARPYGATVVREGRNRDAAATDGEWLAFVDGDHRARAVGDAGPLPPPGRRPTPRARDDRERHRRGRRRAAGIGHSE